MPSDQGEEEDEGEGEEEAESEIRANSASTEQEESKRAEINWNQPTNLTAMVNDVSSLQSQDQSGINFGASDDSLQKMRLDKEVEVAPEVEFDRAGAEVQKRYTETVGVTGKDIELIELETDEQM